MKLQVLAISVALPLGILAFGCPGEKDERDIEASGTIEATEVKVSSKVTGLVNQFRVEEGAIVNFGDTLLVVDHETYDLQLKQALAGADLEEAQLRLLLKGARSEDIAQAEAVVREAEANLKLTADDVKRMQELLTLSSVTQKQKDDAEARYVGAQARYTAAVEALKKLRQFARPEEFSAARARVRQAKAQVDLLRKTIADCYVTAPIGGTITHKPVEAGELVNHGTVVATITKLEKLKLVIYVSEAELGHVHLGQNAEVKIDTYPNRVFKGKVIYISPTAEFTPKNIQTKEDRTKLVFGVKIEVENPEGKMKPGMPADAVLKAGSQPSQ